jgi:ribosome maturation protein Sdo1
MKKNEPFPTLLNKSDAMLYAADTLDRMIGNMKLLSIMHKAFNSVGEDKHPEKSAELKEAMDDMKVAVTGIVDVDLQERAMTAAVKEIRAMANETKLVEARASTRDFKEAMGA